MKPVIQSTITKSHKLPNQLSTLENSKIIFRYLTQFFILNVFISLLSKQKKIFPCLHMSLHNQNITNTKVSLF